MFIPFRQKVGGQLPPLPPGSRAPGDREKRREERKLKKKIEEKRGSQGRNRQSRRAERGRCEKWREGEEEIERLRGGGGESKSKVATVFVVLSPGQLYQAIYSMKLLYITQPHYVWMGHFQCRFHVFYHGGYILIPKWGGLCWRQPQKLTISNVKTN